jgi:hypothetical protein
MQNCWSPPSWNAINHPILMLDPSAGLGAAPAGHPCLRAPFYNNSLQALHKTPSRYLIAKSAPNGCPKKAPAAARFAQWPSACSAVGHVASEARWLTTARRMDFVVNPQGPSQNL